MAQLSAFPARPLDRRHAFSPLPPLVRHDVLVVASGILRGADVALVPVAAFLAFALRFGSLDIDLGHLVVVSFGMILIANAMSFVDAYDVAELGVLRAQVSKVTAGWSVTFALLIAIAYFDKVSDEFPRLWIGLWFALGIGASVGARCGVWAYLALRRRAGTLAVTVAIVAPQDCAMRVLQQCAAPCQDDIEVVGTFEPRLGEGEGGVEELVRLARKRRLDEILVHLPQQRDSGFNAVLTRLGELPANVHLCPDFSDLGLAPRKLAMMREAVMINVFERPLSGWGAVLKRAEDLALSVLLLLLFMPLMAIIALLVKLDGNGPAFFRQPRFGFNNNPILIYKFRTMHVAAVNDPSVPQARRADPRVTRIGRFLRRTSLDELPQLINVLKGEMSLVGPRPHAIAHNEYYATCIDRYLHRHRVKPGITGWAQVNGLRGETPTVEIMHARVKHDLYYIENWSIWLDLWILLRTFAVGFVHPNAY